MVEQEAVGPWAKAALFVVALFSLLHLANLEGCPLLLVTFDVEISIGIDHRQNCRSWPQLLECLLSHDRPPETLKRPLSIVRCKCPFVPSNDSSHCPLPANQCCRWFVARACGVLIEFLLLRRDLRCPTHLTCAPELVEEGCVPIVRHPTRPHLMQTNLTTLQVHRNGVCCHRWFEIEVVWGGP